MHHHRSLLPLLVAALLLPCAPCAPRAAAQTIITIPGASGVTNGSTIAFSNYSTSNTDIVNILGPTSNTIDVATGTTIANLFMAGANSYGFIGTGVTTTAALTLGLTATNVVSSTIFTMTTVSTGTLDFTQITGANNFAGGVVINSGILRVASIQQLGVPSLNKLTFNGNSNGTLLVAGNLTLNSAGGNTNKINLAANSRAIIVAEPGMTFTVKNNTGPAQNDLTFNVANANSLLVLSGTRAGAGGHIVLDGNSSPTRGGGGIHVNNASATVLIDSATFINNYNSYAGSGQYNGGALYVSNGTLTVVDTVFIGNKALGTQTGGSGGAVGNQGGGAATILTMANVLFLSNTAYQAGAFVNAGGLSTFTSATFQYNTATRGSGGSGGGAVQNSGANAPLTFINSLFLSNTSYAGGGAMSITAAIANNLTNVSFLNNAAANAGGAIYVSNVAATINLTATNGATSRFAGNTISGTIGVVNTSTIPNSIYYDITGVLTGTLNVNTDANSTVDMLDPFSANLANVSAALAVVKSGPGTWKLSGTSLIQKQGATVASSININAGTLYLYRAGETVTDPFTSGTYTSSAAAIELRNISTADTNMASYFRLAPGANLAIGGGNSISITSVTPTGTFPNAYIALAPGSILSYNLDTATGTLAPGAGPALLTLKVPDTLPAANFENRIITAGALNPLLNFTWTGTADNLVGNTYNLLTLVTGSGAGRLGSLTNFTSLIQSGTYDGLSYADFNASGYRLTAGVTNNTLWGANLKLTNP